MTTIRGHCLCKAVRFEVEGEPDWCGHCHCESCRRCTSSPVTTFIAVKRAAVKFSGAVSVYESSPGVRRSFCGRCGSPMAFETNARSDEIDLYVASLDYPERAVPQSHVHDAERLPWVVFDDDLTRYSGSSPS